MRDIRSDLQERATLIDEQVKATVAHYAKDACAYERTNAHLASSSGSLAMLLGR
jgi:hypothetical protein